MSAPRHCTEHSFATHDGVALFYRHWPAQGARARRDRAVPSRPRAFGRMAHLVDELRCRTSTSSPGTHAATGVRPASAATARSFGTSVRDVQTFVDHIAAAHGVAVEDMHVVAQSVGAVLAATWAHDYAPRSAAWCWRRRPSRSSSTCPSRARAGADAQAARQLLRQQLRQGEVPDARSRAHRELRRRPADHAADLGRVLLGLYEAADRVVADAAGDHRAGAAAGLGQRLGRASRPQHAFFDRLGSAGEGTARVAGFFHDTLGERDRAARD
jgi:hypothetical protein